MAHAFHLCMQPLLRTLPGLNIRAAIGGAVLAVLIIGEAAFAYGEKLV